MAEQAPPRIDGLLPPEIAQKAEDVGVTKATMSETAMFLLAVLAGAFIAMGAVFYVTVTTGAADLPFGLGKLLGGLVFCLGLILVVIAGAELFTGNNLLVMAWVGGRVSTGLLFKNWIIVYAGNFVGSVATALIMFSTEQHMAAGGQLGLNALNIAHAKCQLEFIPALTRGIYCNALVCLAVWLTMSCRSTGDKILAILFPITAFVAAGFEHSVANMYFVPIGLFLVQIPAPEFWGAIGMSPADFPYLSWYNFVIVNLLPVTLGNIIGGGIFVGAFYWFVYCRRHPVV
ncbi:MAG: formate transporter FocA [Armatimonadia bacterium]|nr:formate transporter FocA [Armatimonadia bacterium]